MRISVICINFMYIWHCFKCYTQNLIVSIPGNMDPTDGTIRFSISINDGSEFILGGSEDNTRYYDTVEVTIMEDDRKL